MLKHYRASQEAQLRWICNHPYQWLALNAALIVAFIGYIKYQDLLEKRKFENQEAPVK